MQVVITTKLIVGPQFIVQLGQLLCRFDVSRAFLDIVNALYIHQRIEESKVGSYTVQTVLVGIFFTQVVG